MSRRSGNDTVKTAFVAFRLFQLEETLEQHTGKICPLRIKTQAEMSAD